MKTQMTETEKREAIGTLYQAADYARIAHHIPGRVRLKFSLAAKKGLKDVDLSPAIEDLPGIRHYRLNTKNGSVVIEYDTQVISQSLWENLINASKEERPQLTEQLLAIWQ